MSAFDELEFLKSVVDSRLRGSPPEGAAAATVGAKPAAASPAPSAGTARDAGGTSSGAAGARPTSGSVPAFLRDVPSEQTKTLKCQECGTMNYPTEWYCERCGAELAAL